jgi:hypothetical protein
MAQHYSYVMLAQKEKAQANLYCLELSNLGVKKVSLRDRLVIDEKFQQNKRRALLTIIFLAYPLFAW